MSDAVHNEWDWTGNVEQRGDTYRVYVGDTGDRMIISEMGDRVGVKLIKAAVAEELKQDVKEEVQSLRAEGPVKFVSPEGSPS